MIENIWYRLFQEIWLEIRVRILTTLLYTE